MGRPKKAAGDGLGPPEHFLHLVWDRVVPDVPDYCHELVAALAEE